MRNLYTTANDFCYCPVLCLSIQLFNKNYLAEVQNTVIKMTIVISSVTEIQMVRINVKIHKTVDGKKQANIKRNFVVRL